MCMLISTSDIRVQFKDDVNLEEDSGTRDGLYLILVSHGTYNGPNDRTSPLISLSYLSCCRPQLT